MAFESVKNERGNFIADANNDDDAHQERRIIEEQGGDSIETNLA